MVDLAPSTEDVSTQAPALTFEGLTVSAATEHGRYTVVDSLDLSIYPGTITGLVGESGSGKTVTALAAMRLLAEPTLRVESGVVRLGDLDLATLGRRALRAVRGERIAMVFQEPMTSLDPLCRVGNLIAEVIRAHRPVSRREAMDQAVRLLEQVGIPNARVRAREYPFQFSGGMRQRVLIAMAMACSPEVLIADEPTTALDVTVQAQILDLLQRIARLKGVGILLVTHDLAVVSEYCDRVAVMYAGQLVETGPTAEVLRAPAHPYTAALLASVLSPDGSHRSLATIEGAVPALNEMPPGCRFAPRCSHARPECDEPVPLRAVDDERAHRCIRSDALTLEGLG